MRKTKCRNTMWCIIGIVTVLAAFAALLTFFLRLRMRKKALNKSDEACTCMSFDCEKEIDPEPEISED